jgi:phosphoglycolate phosphatase
MYKHVYFDLDGTLVNTTAGIVAAYKYLHDRYSLPHPPENELKRWIGPPVRKVISHFLGSTSQQEVELGVKTMREYYFERGWSECELYDGIRELLLRLSAQNILTSVVTAKNIVMSKKVLEHVAIDNLFCEIFGPGLEVDREKGDMLQEIMLRQGAGCESSIMIGDSEYDLKAAKHVGIPAIAVTYGFSNRDELSAHSPWRICNSVPQVASCLGI